VQDRGAASAGYSQPALDLRLNGANLNGAPVDLAVDARTRRTSTTQPDGSLFSEAVTRVYRASLSLHDPLSRYRLTVGRQMSPTLASVSEFDGALGEYTGARWGAGVFSGSQPDPAGDQVSREIVESGGFVEMHARALDPTRWSAALGAVTSTDSGQTNRDFLFAQGDVHTSLWSAMVTQEIDVNRGWRRAAGDPVLVPTSTFLLARVQATRLLSLNAGYDNRRSVRLYRDRLTPETEFDDQFREGGWVGASYEVGSHVRVDGDLRARGGAASDRSHAWSLGSELYRLGLWNTTLRTRYARFTSVSVGTWLASLSLGVDPLPALHVEGTGGRRNTDELLAGGQEAVDWMSADVDVALARRWFVNGSVERDRSDVDRLFQEYMALSWRF
jgi:hypothetical protein